MTKELLKLIEHYMNPNIKDYLSYLYYNEYFKISSAEENDMAYKCYNGLIDWNEYLSKYGKQSIVQTKETIYEYIVHTYDCMESDLDDDEIEVGGYEYEYDYLRNNINFNEVGRMFGKEVEKFFGIKYSELPLR